MTKKTRSLLATACLAFLIASCDKDDAPAPEVPKVTTGVYVMNEGAFGTIGASMTFYDFAANKATTDFYENVNGNSLGDTGNDLLLYGGKIYIVMNGDSYVQVANAFTGKAIKRIDFLGTGGNKRQPRYAVPYKNKVLVSSFDGTVAVLDTTTFNVDKWITVGTNPDGLAVSGDRLYVANSGGFNFPLFDSTVSVVDLNSLAEIQKIKVGVNPGSVVADNSGNVYVACTGNYDNIGPKLVKINTVNNTVAKSADTAAGKLRYFNNALYVTGGYLGSAHVRKLNTTDFSQVSSNFITDGTSVVNPYGVDVDPANGDVYITDAKDFSSSGEVFCFDKNGKRKFSFSVSPGVNPNTVVLIKP